MKLSDYVVTQLANRYICNHHEQASEMAATCYARVCERNFSEEIR